MKVLFADFTDFSSAVRVSSKRKNRTMYKTGSPAPSLNHHSSGGRNSGSSSSSKVSHLATDRHTKRRVGVHPSVSCPSSGGLTPTPTSIPPPPFDVTPFPAGATLASPVTDKAQPGCSRGTPADTPPSTSNS